MFSRGVGRTKKSSSDPTRPLPSPVFLFHIPSVELFPLHQGACLRRSCLEELLVISFRSSTRMLAGSWRRGSSIPNRSVFFLFLNFSTRGCMRICPVYVALGIPFRTLFSNSAPNISIKSFTHPFGFFADLRWPAAGLESDEHGDATGSMGLEDHSDAHWSEAGSMGLEGRGDVCGWSAAAMGNAASPSRTASDGILGC